MLCPQEWNVPVGNGSNSLYESRLLAQARDVYGTKLSPIKVKTFMNNDDPTWQDSYTKCRSRSNLGGQSDHVC